MSEERAIGASCPSACLLSCQPAGCGYCCVQEAVSQLFPSASLHTAYGMTEAASSITFKVLRSPQGAPHRTLMPRAAVGHQGPPDPMPGLSRAGRAALPGDKHRAATADAPGGHAAARAGAGVGQGHAAGGAGMGVCVGSPGPGVEVRVCSLPGFGAGVGEVQTRGRHVMMGYWRNEEETLKVRCEVVTS